MNNKKNGKNFISCYEDECRSIKDKNCDFDLNLDFEFDINETDEYFTNELENIHNEDNEDNEESYQEGYQDGYKDGYEKAKQEVLDYMKKNKCCIKCKHN